MALAACGGNRGVADAGEASPAKLAAGTRFATGADGAFCAPGVLDGQSAMADAITAARNGDRVALAALIDKRRLVKLEAGVPVEYMTESGGLYYVRVNGGREIGERCWVLPGQVERK